MKLKEVVGVEYSGTSLSRSYRPTISAKEYETRKYIHAIKNINHEDLSVSQFVTILLEHEDGKKTLEELEELEKLIQERKQQIIVRFGFLSKKVVFIRHLFCTNNTRFIDRSRLLLRSASLLLL